MAGLFGKKDPVVTRFDGAVLEAGAFKNATLGNNDLSAKNTAILTNTQEAELSLISKLVKQLQASIDPPKESNITIAEKQSPIEQPQAPAAVTVDNTKTAHDMARIASQAAAIGAKMVEASVSEAPSSAISAPTTARAPAKIQATSTGIAG